MGDVGVVILDCRDGGEQDKRCEQRHGIARDAAAEAPVDLLLASGEERV